MDLMDDKLSDLILSPGGTTALPNHWRDEPLFHECLAELSACSLTRLASEPEHLRESHRRVVEQNQSLATANYHTFIRTAQCSRDIFTDFEAVEGRAARTVSSIPQLNSACETFLKEAQRITMESKMNAVTLGKHTQVLEILEIPQVMETCVRNGYYDEALEVVSYAKRLERKHSSLAVVQRVVEEVRQTTQQLLNQLVHQLKGNLQLPSCLKAIGYLRRMEVFTEAELRLKFLQSRDAWLQNLVKAIPRDDPYQYATRLIEVTRVHLFDIVTQYRAVFSDEDPLLSSRDDEAGMGANDSALFHSWLVLKVSQFLTGLTRELDRMATLSSSGSPSGRYQSLLAQSMYFGQSFSRVGCDFRPHLAEIFNAAIYNQFKAVLDRSLSEFVTAIPVYSLSLPSAAGTPGSAIGSHSPLGLASGEVAAPQGLLEFPLLALLCNHILQAMNNLRLCCPLNIMPKVTSSLTACLQSAASCLAAYHRGERGSLTAREEEAFTSMCRAFASLVVPHVNYCLSHLWPRSRSEGGAAPVRSLPPPGLGNRKVGRQTWCRQVIVDLVLAPLEEFLPREQLTAQANEEVEIEEENLLDTLESNMEPNEEPSATLPANEQDVITEASISVENLMDPTPPSPEEQEHREDQMDESIVTNLPPSDQEELVSSQVA